MIRSAFTLVELLIAMALGVVLVTIAWSGFQHALQSSRRAQAVLAQHQSARFIFESIQQEVAAVQHVCASYARVEPPTAANAADPHNGRLTVVFATARSSNDKFEDNGGTISRMNGDIRWFMLRWSRMHPATDALGQTIDRDGVLSISFGSDNPRETGIRQGANVSSYSNRVYWGPSASDNWSGRHLRYMANPVRTLVEIHPDTGYPRMSGLNWQLSRAGFDGATWGMFVTPNSVASFSVAPATKMRPTWVDYGDFDDLERTLQALNTRVHACVVTIHEAGGGLTTLDPVGSPGSAEYFWDGIPVDGTPGFRLAPPGSADPDKILSDEQVLVRRPARMDVSLVLRDQARDISVPLILSFQLPVIGQ